jgi:hypothetical protein
MLWARLWPNVPLGIPFLRMLRWRGRRRRLRLVQRLVHEDVLCQPELHNANTPVHRAYFFTEPNYSPPLSDSAAACAPSPLSFPQS